MAADLTPERLVPFRWPSAWKDPQLVALFARGPVNCLVFDGAPPAAVAEAAQNAGLAVRERAALHPASMAEVKWDSPEPIVAIAGVAWPRMVPMARRGADAVSGPTGAPWIDSVSWVTRLAASRAPGKQIWLDLDPLKDAVPNLNAYRVALADCAAAGARWVVSPDPALAAGMASGNTEARNTWESMAQTLAFFEQRDAWRAWMHDGPLAVISSFAGGDEFLSTEVLNLAARHNLLYRVVDRSAAASVSLAGLRAVLWTDAEPPAPAIAARLTAFAREGGLLIVPRPVAAGFRGGTPVDCPVTGYELRPLGKGAVAAATRDWDDPYFLVLDVHNLVSRRYDPIRLFNGSSLWVHYSTRGGAGLIQLVNFASRGAAVSMRIQRPHRSVSIHTLEAGGPVPLKPVEVDKSIEYYLPSFSVYAALEVTA